MRQPPEARDSGGDSPGDVLARPAVRVLATAAVFFLLVACTSADAPTDPTDGAVGIEETGSPSITPPPPEGSASDADGTPDDDPATSEQIARVTRVIDGDTIEVELDGSIVDVRFIGIDTPETVHPTEPLECYGRAASRFTTELLEGEEVRLEFDVERLDRFGRTLAYVWLSEELVNETLVVRGFAQVSTFPPNVKYVDVFVRAQREARQDDRGLWGPRCAPESPTMEGGAGDGGGGGGNCDASYPGVCIPPYPPDLDCGEISFTNFQVTGSDPHGFDGDNDGVGCET